MQLIRKQNNNLLYINNLILTYIIIPEFRQTNHYFIRGKRYFWQYYLQLLIFKEI